MAVSLVSLSETDRLGGTVAGHPSATSPYGLRTPTGEADDRDDCDLMNCLNWYMLHESEWISLTKQDPTPQCCVSAAPIHILLQGKKCSGMSIFLWGILIPLFNQSKQSAGSGLVPVLVHLWRTGFLFHGHESIVRNHYETVGPLHAYIGIQTWSVFGPLLLWSVKIVLIFCLFSYRPVRTCYLVLIVKNGSHKQY